MKWLKNLFKRIKMELRYRKRKKEWRKRDPYVYK